MIDTEGYSYVAWLGLLTETLITTIKDEKIDLSYGDNQLLKKQITDHFSSTWERIHFFEQRLPNTDDLSTELEYLAAQLPTLKAGHRQEYLMADEHVIHVEEWLANKHFIKGDYDFIIGREHFMAEKFFLEDDMYDEYMAMDAADYVRLRLQTIFKRFLRDYPAYYKPYEQKGVNQNV